MSDTFFSKIVDLKLSQTKLIIITSIFLVALTNFSFFSHVIEIYPVTFKNIGFLLSIAVLFGSTIILLASFICTRYTIKPVLIITLITSSIAAYFMDSYNTIFDDTMIMNILHTNSSESIDLLSFKLFFYLTLLGISPAYIIYKLEIKEHTLKLAIINRAKLIITSLIIIITCLLTFGSHYASFFREHKPLRFYTNPTYYIYSGIKYIKKTAFNKKENLIHIAQDAHILNSDTHRELIIMVAGETARADRFSLNGYQRETNPLLKNFNVLSYTNVWACGTSTGISIPCEFSIHDHDKFELDEEEHSENLLDILEHVGVNVLWRDNNSTSQGVAIRQGEENFKTPENNPECDIECRDTGMLTGLQNYIDLQPKGDIFIVLHQMGSHGPAYYKRYPDNFEKFKPTCKSNQLETCTTEEINNTYDNTILYTDYFLSKVIELLKKNTSKFETSMFYISDHGESLGENGMYLHGMPNFMAPDEQKHVPLIVWLDPNNKDFDLNKMKQKLNKQYSHDNIFHTMLGFMEIQTSIYQPTMDMLEHAEHNDIKN